MFEQRFAEVFGMTDEVWLRHANPWSPWTRLSSMPLLFLSIWSRKWIRWWAVVPTLITALWIWTNPRVFPKPKSTNNWMSKAILGERVWLNKKNIPVPEHFERRMRINQVISSSGLLVAIWGLAKDSARLVVVGNIVFLAVKPYGLDVMADLYDEMKDSSPEYQSWLY